MTNKLIDGKVFFSTEHYDVIATNDPDYTEGAVFVYGLVNKTTDICEFRVPTFAEACATAKWMDYVLTNSVWELEAKGRIDNAKEMMRFAEKDNTPQIDAEKMN